MFAAWPAPMGAGTAPIRAMQGRKAASATVRASGTSAATAGLIRAFVMRARYLPDPSLSAPLKRP